MFSSRAALPKRLTPTSARPAMDDAARPDHTVMRRPLPSADRDSKACRPHVDILYRCKAARLALLTHAMAGAMDPFLQRYGSSNSGARRLGSCQLLVGHSAAIRSEVVAGALLALNAPRCGGLAPAFSDSASMADSLGCTADAARASRSSRVEPGPANANATSLAHTFNRSTGPYMPPVSAPPGLGGLVPAVSSNVY